MEDDIRRSQEAGFIAHLTKPIDFAKLEAMIRQVAAEHGVGARSLIRARPRVGARG